MSSTPFLPGRPLSLGELLDATFRIYRKHFKPFILTAGALLVPLQVLMAILVSLTVRYQAIDAPVRSWIPFISFPQLAPDPTAGNMSAFVGLSLILGLAVGVINLIVAIALIWLGIEYLHQRSPSATDAWGTGKSYFWRYFLLLLLQGLILGIPFALVTFVIAVIPGAGIVVMIAFLLVSAFVYTRWFIAPAALVEQNMRAYDALGYSWRMTRPYFWRIVMYAILLFLLNFVIVSMPGYILQMLVISATPEHLYNVAMPLISLISSVLAALWMPINFLAMVMLYFDLRTREEGYDLEMRVQEMENETGPSSPVFSQPSENEESSADD